MADEEKSEREENQRNYYKKLKSYEDELLLEKVEKVKRREKSGWLLPEKERNKCKNVKS